MGAAALAVACAFSIPSLYSAGSPLHVSVTNVRDTSFAVTWQTDAVEIGRVQLVGGGIYDDDRGADFIGTTHSATVSGLAANGSYAFDLIGTGGRDDHGGTHWTVITGALLEPRPPDLVHAAVRSADGSPAAEVLVMATIARVQQGIPSATLSKALAAHDGGFFSIDLAETRSWSDPSSYFDYAVNGDRFMNNSVTLYAVGPAGTGLVTVDMTDARLRAPEPGQEIVIRLSGEPTADRQDLRKSCRSW